MSGLLQRPRSAPHRRIGRLTTSASEGTLSGPGPRHQHKRQIDVPQPLGVNWSKVSESCHTWNRVDTFQTPVGHAPGVTPSTHHLPPSTTTSTHHPATHHPPLGHAPGVTPSTQHLPPSTIHHPPPTELSDIKTCPPGGCGSQQEKFIDVCTMMRTEIREVQMHQMSVLQQGIVEQQKTSKLILDQLSVMQRAIEKINLGVDFRPVLEKIDTIDLRVDMEHMSQLEVVVNPANFGPVLDQHLTATKDEILKHMSQAMADINFGPVFDQLTTVHDDVVEQCKPATINFEPVIGKLDELNQLNTPVLVQQLTAVKDEIFRHMSQTMTEIDFSPVSDQLTTVNHEIVEQFRHIRPIFSQHLTAAKKEIFKHMSETIAEVNFGPIFDKLEGVNIDIVEQCQTVRIDLIEKLAKVNIDIVEQCQTAKIDYQPVLEKIDKIDFRIEHLRAMKDEILRNMSQTMTDKLAKVTDVVEHCQTVKIDLTEKLAKVKHDVVEHCQTAKIDYKPVLERIDKIDLRVEHLTATKDEILRHMSQTMTDKLAKMNHDVVEHCQTAKIDYTPVLQKIDKIDVRVEHLTATKDEIFRHMIEKLAKVNLDVFEQCQTVKIDLTEKLAKVNFDTVQQHLTSTKDEILRHMSQTLTETLAKVNLATVEQCQTVRIDLIEKLAKVNIDIVEQCQTATKDEILRHMSQTVNEKLAKVTDVVEQCQTVKIDLTEKLAKMNHDIVEHCQTAKIDYKPVLEKIDKIDLRVEHLNATKDEITRHISQTANENHAKVNFDIHQQSQTLKVDMTEKLAKVSLDIIEQHLTATKNEILRHVSQTMTQKLAKVNHDIVEQCQTIKFDVIEKLAKESIEIVGQCQTATKEDILRHMSQTITEINCGPIFEKLKGVNVGVVEQCQTAKIDYTPVLEKIDKIDLRVEHLTAMKDEILRHMSQTMTDKLAKETDIVEQCQTAKIDYKPVLEKIDKIDVRVEHLTAMKDEILRHVSQSMTQKLAKVNHDIVEQCQPINLDVIEKLAKESIEIVRQCQTATKEEILRHMSQTVTEKLAKVNRDVVDQCQAVRIDMSEKLARVHDDIVEHCRTTKTDYKPVLEIFDKMERRADLRKIESLIQPNDVVSPAQFELILVQHLTLTKNEILRHLSQAMTEKLAAVSREIVEQCQTAKIDFEPVLEKIDEVHLGVVLEQLTAAKDMPVFIKAKLEDIDLKNTQLNTHFLQHLERAHADLREGQTQLTGHMLNWSKTHEEHATRNEQHVMRKLRAYNEHISAMQQGIQQINDWRMESMAATSGVGSLTDTHLSTACSGEV